ncbi:MAG: DegV family protein [Firmicutes bacterium]|nr:DegV family protein [Bacillota bacterium]
MMIKITADSTCDLSPSFLESNNITLVPLYVLLGEKSYRDGVDITPAEIFEYVKETNKLSKTAAVNTYDYVKVFEELSPKYEAVIHISLGSVFSSSHQNARLAAQEFPNVYVVDSCNLSSGSGHLVYEAAQMAAEKMDPQEICQKLEDLVPKIDASFVIDRLDYLHKGGRCSGLEAFGANLLRIKPCIEVIDGKMTVGKKYRGSFENCLKKYVKDRLQANGDIDYSRIFVTHTVSSPETVAMVKELIQEYAGFEEIIETNAGCTISSHCGPNTLGILYKRKSKKTNVSS